MKSAWVELRRYRSTRFGLPVFGTLAVVLCLCALTIRLASTATRSFNLPLQLLAVLLLLFALRLWDDLCDVKRDRATHPERVLCQSRSLLPFALAAVLAAALGVTALALLPDAAFALSVVAGLGLLLSLWYAVGRRLLRRRLANAAVVLLKYPALVLASSGPAAAGVLLAVLAPIYLAFGVYEVVHDPTTLTE